MSSQLAGRYRAFQRRCRTACQLVGTSSNSLGWSCRKGSQVGRAAAMIGAGAVILGLPALVLLFICAFGGIDSRRVSDPVALSVTGAGRGAGFGTLIGIGLRSLSDDALKPSVTLDQVQRDKAAAKEMVR